MRQMNINPSMVEPVNYEDTSLHVWIRELQPVVFRDGYDYCCIWDQIGPKVSWAADPKKDWIKSLEERLEDNEEDELIQEIRARLSQTKNEVW